VLGKIWEARSIVNIYFFRLLRIFKTLARSGAFSGNKGGFADGCCTALAS
jgi:hypothetical protein